MAWRKKTPDTIASLKRSIVGDSLERRKQLDKLIRMVRAEEQAKAAQSADQ